MSHVETSNILHMETSNLKNRLLRGASVVWLSVTLDIGSGHDLRVVYRAQYRVCLRFSLSISLCPCPHTHFLSIHIYIHTYLEEKEDCLNSNPKPAKYQIIYFLFLNFLIYHLGQKSKYSRVYCSIVHNSQNIATT